MAQAILARPQRKSIAMTLSSAAPFTHAIQKAGDAAEHTDPQGPIDLAGFLRAVDAFPWREQLAAWDELQDGPLPALVLQNTANQAELWVSALGSGEITGYQLHLMRMKLRKAFFGMGQEKLAQQVTTASVDTRQDVDRLCGLFHDQRLEVLEEEMQRLEEAERNRNDD